MRSPERETLAIEALTTLDWHSHPITTARARIISVLAIPEDQAVPVLQDFMRRGLIALHPEQEAPGGLVRSRWVQP